MTYSDFLGILYVSNELQDKKRLANKIGQIYDKHQIQAQDELDEYLKLNGMVRNMGMIQKK